MKPLRGRAIGCEAQPAGLCSAIASLRPRHVQPVFRYGSTENALREDGGRGTVEMDVLHCALSAAMLTGSEIGRRAGAEREPDRRRTEFLLHTS
jgi:hypothetical protein